MRRHGTIYETQNLFRHEIFFFKLTSQEATIVRKRTVVRFEVRVRSMRKRRYDTSTTYDETSTYRCRPKVYQLWYTGTYCTEVYTSKVASICLCELEGLSRCNTTIIMSKLLVVLCVFDWSCPQCLSPTYCVHDQQYLYTLDILLLVCIQETSHHPHTHLAAD